MPVQTEVEKVKTASVIRKGGQAELGTFTVSRDQNGLSISVKSKAIEDFFKAVCQETVSKDTQGRKFYKFLDSNSQSQLEMASDGMRIHFGQPDGTLINYSEVNMGFLRLSGIGDGLEVKFSGVYSKPMMAKLSRAIKACISNLYINYIKSYKMSCDIQTIEYHHVDATQV